MKSVNPLLRSITNIDSSNFRPYDRYDTVVPGMHWLPLSGELLNGEYECFMLRMDPGTSSRPHEHMGHEEFLMLEGSLIDNDGTEFKTGEFIKFAPGSIHSSQTPDGCLMLVMLRGNNRALSKEEINP